MVSVLDDQYTASGTYMHLIAGGHSYCTYCTYGLVVTLATVGHHCGINAMYILQFESEVIITVDHYKS